MPLAWTNALTPTRALWGCKCIPEYSSTYWY